MEFNSIFVVKTTSHTYICCCCFDHGWIHRASWSIISLMLNQHWFVASVGDWCSLFVPIETFRPADVITEMQSGRVMQLDFNFTIYTLEIEHTLRLNVADINIWWRNTHCLVILFSQNNRPNHDAFDKLILSHRVLIKNLWMKWLDIIK